MATDFIMPRMPDPQSQSKSAFYPAQQRLPSPQQYQYQQQLQQPHSAQISPLSTSGNASPTSPKSYMSRQTRPAYMPAVLRPNEFPYKGPTRAATEDETTERTINNQGSYLSLSGLGAFGRLSRRSTGDSGKCLDNDWDIDHFPKPTSPPTRNHWKPDQEASICDEATCKRYFNYFTRRHHCRKCGNIFCDSHSGQEVPLDEDANYNPRGTPSRACQHCFSEFKEWRSRASSRTSSLDSANSTPTQPAASPIATSSPPGTAQTPTLAQTPQASVPRDWNWSTF